MDVFSGKRNCHRASQLVFDVSEELAAEIWAGRERGEGVCGSAVQKLLMEKADEKGDVNEGVVRRIALGRFEEALGMLEGDGDGEGVLTANRVALLEPLRACVRANVGCDALLDAIDKSLRHITRETQVPEW